MNLDVLLPGDTARCAGTVVQTRTGFAVLRFDVDSPPRTDLHELHWSSTESVDFSLMDGGEAGLVGRTVAVTGRWTGTGIADGAASAVAPPQPTVVTYTPEDPSIYRYLDPDQVRRARPDVLMLLDEGVLVSHIPSYVEVHVVAHDVLRAVDVLRPHYGDALTVRQCPIPPSVFRLMAELVELVESEGVGFSSGGGFEFDFENTTYIEVSHITAAMKELALDIPDGAVSVLAQATAASPT